MRKPIFALIALCITLDAAANSSDESRLIASVANGNSSGVIVVAVFGGYFPIPSRYALVASYKGDDIRFVAPAFLPLEFGFSGPEEASTIMIRRDHVCDFLYAKPTSVAIEENAHVENLHFQLSKIKIDGSPETSLVEISDGTGCISIAGDDIGFWRDSLRVYSELRRKSRRHGSGETER